MDSLSEKVFEIFQKIFASIRQSGLRSYFLPIGIAVLGLIFLGIGLIQMIAPAKTTDVAVQNSSPQKFPTTPILSVQVDVEGAVVNPGVYKLPQNARVQDGLIAAGGLSASADRGVVAKSLNLAAKLTDGAKIYIPKVGDTPVQSASEGQAGIQSSSDSVLAASTGLVNINTATADQLDALPGIGPVSAQKIINARPFTSVDDLLTKKAVTKSTFTKIKDLVTAE